MLSYTPISAIIYKIEFCISGKVYVAFLGPFSNLCYKAGPCYVIKYIVAIKLPVFIQSLVS